MMDKEIISYRHLVFLKARSFMDNSQNMVSYTSNIIIFGINKIIHGYPISVLLDYLTFWTMALNSLVLPQLGRPSWIMSVIDQTVCSFTFLYYGDNTLSFFTIGNHRFVLQQKRYIPETIRLRANSVLLSFLKVWFCECFETSGW